MGQSTTVPRRNTACHQEKAESVLQRLVSPYFVGIAYFLQDVLSEFDFHMKTLQKTEATIVDFMKVVDKLNCTMAVWKESTARSRGTYRNWPQMYRLQVGNEIPDDVPRHVQSIVGRFCESMIVAAPKRFDFSAWEPFKIFYMKLLPDQGFKTYGESEIRKMCDLLCVRRQKD